MKHAVLFLALSVCGLASPSCDAQAPPVTLQGLRDHQRVLLVLSNGDNRLAESQLAMAAAHVDGFHERDLLLVGLSGSDPAVPAASLSGEDDAAARRRFHVRPGEFTVILIGKDGGEKLRSHEPLSWDTLRGTLDAMPMRQDEIRQRR